MRVGLVYGGLSVTALIEDDGCGFDLASITGAPSSPNRGLGLQGLAARASHLGGTLHIDSTPQWGTRVRAEVPYSPSMRAETSRSRWRVLVVHDRAVVRAGLVRMLSQVEPDIQVVGEIGDAVQAVEAYELVRPHVVLADLELAHVDGVQLTAYLRAADPDAAVVLLIGSIADDRVRAAARIGAVGFVERDADPADARPVDRRSGTWRFARDRRVPEPLHRVAGRAARRRAPHGQENARCEPSSSAAFPTSASPPSFGSR